MQKGGYKLKKELRDLNPSNDDIFYNYVTPMILNTGSRFVMVSSDSLFSFVVKMEVPISSSPFVDDDGPVNSFLLKVCLIKPLVSSPNYALEKKQAIKKHLLSEHDFIQEAFVQQQIWDQSMELGLSVICSKLTNVIVVRETEIATNVINKIFTDDLYKNYMLSEIVKGNSLGIITMEPLSGVSLSRVPANKYYDCYVKLLAIVLRLFFVHGVIHCDLHVENNIFDLNTGRSSAIDFGRTITVDAISEKINKYGKGINDYKIKVEEDISKGGEIPQHVEESYKNLLERFEEWHMLKFCFEKGKRELDPVKKEEVRNALWFIINFEVRWMEEVYFADNYSNIRTLLSVILSKFPISEESIYADILSNYNMFRNIQGMSAPVNGKSQVKPFASVDILYPSISDYHDSYSEFLKIGMPDANGSLSETFKLSEHLKNHTGSTIVDDEEDYLSLTKEDHTGSTYVDEEDDSNILLDDIENFINPPPPPSNENFINPPPPPSNDGKNKRKYTDVLDIFPSKKGGNKSKKGNKSKNRNKTNKRINRTKKQPKSKKKVRRASKHRK